MRGGGLVANSSAVNGEQSETGLKTVAVVVCFEFREELEPSWPASNWPDELSEAVHRTAIIIVLVYFNISLQWRNTVKPRIGMSDTRSEYVRRDIYVGV